MLITQYIDKTIEGEWKNSIETRFNKDVEVLILRIQRMRKIIINNQLQIYLTNIANNCHAIFH
jgi:hypothetical protein